MDCSMPGFPVLHHLSELAQTHVLWVDDAIQPSCCRRRKEEEGGEEREKEREARRNEESEGGKEKFRQKRTCVHVCSVTSDSLRHSGPQPTRLLYPWGFSGKNAGAGCRFLLQGIFLTQGSNPHLLHCRQILHHWAIREAWQKRKATHTPQSPSTVLQSRHFDKCFLNRTKLLEYPLISSFLPQPQAWVKSERKHSFRFQPTNHPWDLGEGLALRVGSHRSKQHLEC